MLSELGINIEFSNHTNIWNDVAVIMKSTYATRENSFHMKDSDIIKAYTDCIKHIFNAMYRKADLI